MITATNARCNGTLNGKLLPQHLADLRKSGLSDEQIARCGFHSLQAPARIQTALRWKRYGGELGPCLAIPFLDGAGKKTDYLRLKPDRPRKAKEDGKPIKYESPKGAGNRAFFPPATLAALQNPDVPLLVTEGEKKAAKADQEGFPCIGLVGVYGWQRKLKRDAEGKATGERALIDDLASIAWKGRAVYVCFDSDAADNSKVRLAEAHLAETLARHGAIVKIVRLPPGEAGADGKPAKVGLDDYLVGHGPNAFRALLESATDAISPELPPVEAIDDPHRLCREYLSQEASHADRERIAFYREQFWQWDGRCWQAIRDAQTRGKLSKFAKRQLDKSFVATVQPHANEQSAEGRAPKVPKVTTGLVSNVMQALSGEVSLDQDTPQPAWLGRGAIQRNYLTLDNGILDVDALLADEQGVLGPHTPLWFSPVCLPYRFDPTAGCPLWQKFLQRNLAGEVDKIGLLQQFAGYLLLPDTSKQRFLMMTGEGANGKSVVCAVLRGLLGIVNVSSVPLELFGDKFRLAGTLGKLANIVAEVGEMDKIAEGQLKAFVTGDPMEFEQKFKTPFTATPTARLVLATNNPPQFSDRSDGLWRRMLLLHFTVQIPEAERVAGMDTAEFWQKEGELAGVLNWALAGLHALRTQGRFIVPQVCREAAEKLRTDSNPARRFLKEHYRAGSGEIPTAELYDGYAKWCKDHGHHALAEIGFGREVTRCFPAVTRGKKGPRGNRHWLYCGIDTASD
jgi:putative DNA primase/helicase